MRKNAGVGRLLLASLSLEATNILFKKNKNITILLYYNYITALFIYLFIFKSNLIRFNLILSTVNLSAISKTKYLIRKLTDVDDILFLPCLQTKTKKNINITRGISKLTGCVSSGWGGSSQHREAVCWLTFCALLLLFFSTCSTLKSQRHWGLAVGAGKTWEEDSSNALSYACCSCSVGIRQKIKVKRLYYDFKV